MYYPWGWPRLLKLPQDSVQEIQSVVCNRDKILTAVLTSDSVLIWYVKPCVPIISHRRSPESVQELGRNVLVQWRPDSAMIVVATELGHLIIYHLVVPTDVKTLYELIDPPTPSLRRESDELFVKELIPPLIFSLAFEVVVEGGVSDLVAIRDELMVATKDGKILRYSWEGQEIRDYSLDLRRIPFCVDQQVLKAIPLTDKGAHVRCIAYSPLIGGYALVLNDGRAAFLVASTLNFDPNSVTGVWALNVDDAQCVALNHKYKLIAFGRKCSEGIVYSIDEMTGGLVISHRLILPTRDYPGCPGPVSCIKWTPDGTALAMAWQHGGFSIWSTFGAMIMCSLCWDYGPNVSDPVVQNPLCIKSMDWSAEGYQLWLVNSKNRTKPTSANLFGFSSDPESSDKREETPEVESLKNRALVLQFFKSPVTVNPWMTKQTCIYLQGEDRLLLNLGDQRRRQASLAPASHQSQLGGRTFSESSTVSSSGLTGNLCGGNTKWTTVPIPHNYIGSSWPIRFTAMDDDCQVIAVAGRTGFAHYSINSRRWRLFGNESQEKDFIVTGGMMWWRTYVVMGCYNLNEMSDELRVYNSDAKLDDSTCKKIKMGAQIIQINGNGHETILYTSDNIITIYSLEVDKAATGSSGNLILTKVRSYDASFIPGLNFHPACVVLVGLSTLKIETHRNSTGLTGSSSAQRDMGIRETSPQASGAVVEMPSLILNICGRVIMIQQTDVGGLGDGRDSPSQMALPTVLATGCETIWFPRTTNDEKPHLTASLWLYCGAHGMRVWLPVFPREGDQGHTFMSKRIMLHFPLTDFYPLAILFEDAVILGAENDTVLYNASNLTTTCLPYSTLQRTSLLFLHPILRQLIRRNLGYHAWEIARTCMTLPYFQHSLELLLHEVLEEEATSTEPIPDALLPSVVDFIQEFPVFHKTIGRCARKTEVALWHHLFSVVGSPRVLFQECLHNSDLETAASYLLILQNLEPPSVAQNHATLLLDAALDKADWDLARELVRFLRTIDPDDMAGGHHDGVSGGVVLPPRASLMSPPQTAVSAEEEISLLLGTLQVPRGRTASITMAKAASGPKEGLQRSNSESKPRTSDSDRVRKPSSGSGRSTDEPSADDFYIDVILQRHARKLLGHCRLKDLGTFAAQLDFQMVGWLKREATRAARIDNFVLALKRIHSDFGWPFPVLVTGLAPPLPTPPSLKTSSGSRKYSNSSEVSSTIIGSSAAGTSPAIYHLGQQPAAPPSGSCGRKQGAFGHGISDSGYLSHATNELRNQSKTSSERSGKESALAGPETHLSEQTIHAMLRPLSFREDLSVLSEDMNSLLGGEDQARLSPTSDWSSPQQQTPTNDGNNSEVFNTEFVSKGPQKSEVQLRYLLQIVMEANCLEIASLISVILKDALALIRIVNAVRSPPEDKTSVSRIFQSLKALEAWAQSECHGYTPFFQAIQPQLNSLRTFLLNQSTKTVIGQNVTSASQPVTSPLSVVTSPLGKPDSSLFMRRAMGPGLTMASAPGSARTSPLQDTGQKLSSQSYHGKPATGEKLSSTPIAAKSSVDSKVAATETAVKKDSGAKMRGEDHAQSFEYEDQDDSNCRIM